MATALLSHAHDAVAAAYDHLQPGFQPARLLALFERAGCEVSFSEVTSRERRPPHFEVVTLYASRPERTAGGAPAASRPRRGGRR